MKKEVVMKLFFTFVIFTFLLSGVFAVSEGTCAITTRAACTNDRTNGYIIMGLAASTNSHGQLNGQTPAYGYVLCCGFGIGSTTCTGTNKIIGLSSSTIAHAESPSSHVYDVLSPVNNICYGDLSCSATTASSCPTDHPLGILSLSSTTNAHIGAFADYSTKICCSGTLNYPCALTSAYWSVDGVNPITSASSSVVNGQTVYLIVKGSSSNACNGKKVSFAVSPSVTTNPSNAAFDGDTAKIEWTSEWQSAGLLGGDTSYSFKSTLVSDTTKTVTSSTPKLTVTNPADYCAGITTCDGYKDANQCNTNSPCNTDLKQQGSDIGFDCTQANAYCSCKWDSATSTCSFTYGQISVACHENETLCQSPLGPYCYPGNTCPGGTNCPDGQVLCDGVCYDPTKQQCSDDGHLCGLNQVYCNGACHNSLSECSSGCTSGVLCDGTCCTTTSGLNCIKGECTTEGGGTTCTSSQFACDGTCCTNGQNCFGGAHCCADGQIWDDTTSACISQSSCTTNTCDGVCCSSSEPNCVNNQCSSSNGGTCPTGQVLCNSVCYDPTKQQCSDDGHLCSLNQVYCNGACHNSLSECSSGCTSGVLCDGTCCTDDTGLDCINRECTPHGGTSACNNDGVCDSGEGCTCADCNAQQDSCVFGLTCVSGTCYAPGVPIINDTCDYGYTLCRDPKTLREYCYPGDTCPPTDNPTCNNNGSCDPGEGCSCTADCKDGDTDTCTSGLFCNSGTCYSSDGPTLLGSCKITQTIDKDCNTAPVGYKTISWHGTWTGTTQTGTAHDQCIAGGTVTVPCPAQVQLPFFDYLELIGSVIFIGLIYIGLIFKKKIFRKK
jgi:hypothetical protein